MATASRLRVAMWAAALAVLAQAATGLAKLYVVPDMPAWAVAAPALLFAAGCFAKAAFEAVLAFVAACDDGGPWTPSGDGEDD